MQNGKSLITLLFAVAAWELFCASGVANPVVVASPGESAAALWRMAKAGTLHRDTFASLSRVLIAVGVASAVAIPFGLLLALLPTLKQLFRPLIDFLRTIPPIAIFPPLVIAFGPFDTARILTAAFGAALVMGLIVATATAGMSSTRARYYLSQSVPRRRVFFAILIPEALPSIVVALRAGASLAFVFVIVTELFLGSELGLGSRLQYAQVMGNMPDAYAAMLAIGLSGTFINRAIDALDRRTRALVE